MTRQSDQSPGALALSRADLALLTLLFAFGVAIGFQGWRSTTLNQDYVPYYDQVRALLEQGRIPTAGHLGSMTAFFPPGATYLFVPGVLLFHDIRLWEAPISVLSHGGSLLFLFLIARQAFGLAVARLSVVLFGLSQLGLMPWDGFLIGHTGSSGLFLAEVWCMAQWASRRRPGYFALMLGLASLAVYAQHPLQALMLTSAPVIWARHRPPVRSRSLVAVCVLSLLVWSPYIAFQVNRGFADVKGMAQGGSLLPASYTSSWCDPGLNVRLPAPPLRTPAEEQVSRIVNGPLRLVKPALWRAWGVAFAVGTNFRQLSSIPLAPWLLLALILVVPLQRHGGVRGWLTAWRTSGSARSGAPARTPGSPGEQAAVLGLLVPWGVLALLVEPGRSDRMFWLWPLQALMIAAATVALLPGLRSRTLRALLVVGVTGTVACSPFVTGQLRAWREGGWRGEPSHLMQAVAYVAGEIRAAGRDHASIGYQMNIPGLVAWNNIVDRRYKVGAELDAALGALYGITNDNHCAEGLAPGDDWRIVQDRPEPKNARWNTATIPADAHTGFALHGLVGPYGIYRRVTPAAPFGRITANATPFHGTLPGLPIESAPSGTAPVASGSRLNRPTR